MSRETYQVPPPTGVPAMPVDGPQVSYECGECAAKVSLKRGDQIRCKHCGHRVLYKERTKRMVQFQAR